MVTQQHIFATVLTLILTREKHGSKSILARASVSEMQKSTLEKVRVLMMKFL